jgi:chaperonin GroES
MSVNPLGDRLVIKALEAKQQTDGGIILPETAQEKPQQGEVIAVGAGRALDDGSRKPSELKTGDKVLYGKYAGTEIRIDDEEYLVLREDDILAIVG